MRSFYGEASNQGAAMPGKMPAEVLTPGKSSPRCYLDYAARADTSLAKGVAILRQLPSRNGSLRRPCDWSMNRPETHACGADEWSSPSEWRARWLDPANAYDRRIQLSADLSDFSLTCRHESTDATSASTPIDIECARTQFWDMGAIKRNDRCDSRINCIHKMSGQQI